ncbi:hypothetical protein CAEBREN_08891 [Caenorhabditis brenneri]|uniref:CWH43-like N-terminal domain-containing protein n=1 Tax=Caenorhabditis brenneri TaxID=135651 RepID=G0P4N8_CAEBE|nr:hypothetical protein CAEBREN_08891 [Caenorhabditis brenneri]
MLIEKRFESVHKKKSGAIELFQLNTTLLFWVGFVPPLFAAVFAILTAITLHQDKITNYAWICGRAFLPSLSRIINLTLEGLVWQLCIFFHIPFRLLELSVGWVRYGRLESKNNKRRFWYKMHRHLYVLFGVTELILLSGLSAIGEKEHGTYEMFALVEYLDVFMVIFYHGCCVYWDIQHKVIFSVRLNKNPTKSIKTTGQEMVSEL